MEIDFKMTKKLKQALDRSVLFVKLNKYQVMDIRAAFVEILSAFVEFS